MPTPKTEVITTRVTARDAQVLRSVAALEDVTLSFVAARALRDFTTSFDAARGIHTVGRAETPHTEHSRHQAMVCIMPAALSAPRSPARRRGI